MIGNSVLCVLVISLNHVLTQDVLISTTGCKIQNYDIRFKESESQVYCGVRDITVRKVRDGYIQFIGKKKYDHCCFRYILRSNVTFMEDKRVAYSTCTTFLDKEVVRHTKDLINVRCRNKGIIVYDDVYAIAKAITDDTDIDDDDDILSKTPENKTQPLYNVLMIGMDSISRKRAYSSLNYTVDYFNRNGWLDFRAFNKIDTDSFSNLMAILTGTKESPMSNSTCSKDMSDCNYRFIWERYRNHGYVTAYGADSVYLKNMFLRFGSNGFSEPPTDHYMMPLFQDSEKKGRGPSVCTKRSFSGMQILNYITSLAQSYKELKKWFGFFWINSFSHETDQSPQVFDAEISHFFKKLHDSGLLEDTFVIFFSTNGMLSGPMRYPVESFSDERLPMLFMHVPVAFRKSYKYSNLEVNQFRLVSPYDLYLTLRDILKLSADDAVVPRSEDCPRCMSLFHHIPDYRICSHAGINDEWCTCYEMTKTSTDEYGAMYSVIKAVEHFNYKVANTQTKRCTSCKKPAVQGVLRVHSYQSYDNSSKYFVVVFDADPAERRYEAIIRKYVEQDLDTYAYEVLSLRLITKYNNSGYCVLDKGDQPICICQKINSYDCLPKRKLPKADIFLPLIS